MRVTGGGLEWLAGVNPLANFCPPEYEHGTYNIEHYSLGGFTIGNTKDHSKMAIVNNGRTVCIGGINRMESQEGRYGVDRTPVVFYQNLVTLWSCSPQWWWHRMF